MARTPSNMVPIGFKAPSFELYDTNSKQILKSKNYIFMTVIQQNLQNKLKILPNIKKENWILKEK